MGFTLDKVVPWGRSFAEYVAMFDLSEDDLKLPLVGCGDGPAGFNAKLSIRGGNITSVDPLYGYTVEQIRSRIAETYPTVMAQLRKNRDDYVWQYIRSIEELGRIRMSAMDAFLADFETGKKAGRYIAGELPALPYENGRFALALSSHFLFLYSNYLSMEFHLAALREMLRVSQEVRVFPLLTLAGTTSPYLDFVTSQLVNLGYGVELKRVAYEFQRGGNQMLVIKPD
jgi:hypothetical protein